MQLLNLAYIYWNLQKAHNITKNEGEIENLMLWDSTLPSFMSYPWSISNAQMEYEKIKCHIR